MQCIICFHVSLIFGFQVKILRDEVRGVSGSVGKSRGAAFVEFIEHQHALVALRVLNNNPGVFSSLSCLVN